MRKWLRGVLLVAAVTAMGIQFLRPARTNPPADPARSVHASVEVPAEVAAILDRACRDCHSNETRWPWYSNVAPVSWFVIDHVNHARSHLNFSQWNSAHAPRTVPDADDLLGAICKEVTAGAMPLRSYTWIHRGAQLTPAEIRSLCIWTDTERAHLKSEASSGTSSR